MQGHRRFTLLVAPCGASEKAKGVLMLLEHSRATRRRLTVDLLTLPLRFDLGTSGGNRIVVTLSLGTGGLERGESGIESASSDGGGVGGYRMSHSTGQSSTSSSWVEGSRRSRRSSEQRVRTPIAFIRYDCNNAIVMCSVNIPSRSYTVSRRIPTAWHRDATFSTLASMYFSLDSSSAAELDIRHKARWFGSCKRPLSATIGRGSSRKREDRDLNTRTSQYSAWKSARATGANQDIAFAAFATSRDVSTTKTQATRTKGQS